LRLRGRTIGDAEGRYRAKNEFALPAHEIPLTHRAVRSGQHTRVLRSRCRGSGSTRRRCGALRQNREETVVRCGKIPAPIPPNPCAENILRAVEA
jgi:hypothetical protein